MNELLAEREKTHGDFKDTARISLELKRVIHSNERVIFSDVQLESLDLICTKLARIMSGDHNAVQHWEDVVGYAQLVVNDLTSSPKAGNED